MPDAPAPHRAPLSAEAVKIEAMARLLRQALRLAEGAEGVAPRDDPPRAEPHHGAHAPHAAERPAAPAPAPAGGEGKPSGGPAQVGFLLQLLSAEQVRLDEAKKEVSRKDAELNLKLQFAKKKEEDLAQREGDVSKLETQLKIRETQLERREEQLKDLSRMKKGG